MLTSSNKLTISLGIATMQAENSTDYGLIMAGAAGGIGGTYGAMPELYLKIFELTQRCEIARAREIQDACCQVIYKMCSGKGNMYAMIKQILRLRGGPDLGGVRAPLFDLTEEDLPIAAEAAAEIDRLIALYC